LLLLVPAVVEQAGFDIAHVLLGKHNLLGDVVEERGLVEGGGVFGQGTETTLPAGRRADLTRPASGCVP
jgi:hypothetical protein